MSDESLKNIIISNFFDPSLFWFIYEKDLDLRDELHRSLQRTMRKRSTTLLESPKENAIGGVFYNDEWHRVQIYFISTNSNSDKTVKLVHFIDQGYFERVEKVYTLPKVYVSIPPFCKKGMLYGVQQTKLEYDLRNTNLNHIKGWSDGIILKIQDILADPTTVVKFEKVLNFENTEIGNIYVENSENIEIKGCLTNYLVEKGCAILDENAFKLDLLNKLSEKETTNKIIFTYNNNQKRQRSKSVSYQKQDSKPNQKSPLSEKTSHHRSTSESREINYKTIKNERKLILEKIGIQKNTNRQSRHQKFISDMENKGIVNDLSNGVEVPSQTKKFDMVTKISRGRGKKIKSESEDSNFSSSSYEFVNETFEDAQENSSKISENSEKSSNFALKTMVRGRGSKKTNSSDSSLDNIEPKPTLTISRLKMLLKKSSKPDSQRENTNNTEKPIPVLENHQISTVDHMKNSTEEIAKPKISSIAARVKAVMAKKTENTLKQDKNDHSPVLKPISRETIPSFESKMISRGRGKINLDNFDSPEKKIIGHGRKINYDSSSDTFDDVFDDIQSKKPEIDKKCSKNGSNQLVFDLPSPDWSKKTPLNNFETKKSITNEYKTQNFNFEEQLSPKNQSISQNEQKNLSKTDSTINISKNFSIFSKGRGYKMQSSTPIVGHDFGSVPNSSEKSAILDSKKEMLDSVPSSPEKTMKPFGEGVLGTKNLNTPQSFSEKKQNDLELFAKICRGRGKKKTSSVTSDSDFEGTKPSLGNKNIKIGIQNVNDNDSIFADKISICSSNSEKPKSIFEGMTGKTNRIQNFRPAGMNINSNSEEETTKSERGSIKLLRGSHQKYSGQSYNKNYDYSDESDFKNKENGGPFLDRRSHRKFIKSGSESSSNEYRDSRPFLDRGCANTSKKKYLSSSSQSDSAKKCLGNFKFDENEETKNVKETTPSSVMSRLKTGHCLCENCIPWLDTNDLVWAENDQNEKKTEKETHKKRSLLPLLQNENNFKKTPIQNILYHENDNFVNTKVLVHSPMSLQRVERVSESTFHPYVIESMRYLNYEKAHRIQTYSWCAIARGFHTVIINGPRSGKSMSYIPPMCSEILYTENPAPPNYGPQILVIVPGVEIGDHIRTLMCNMYYKSSKKPRVYLAVPPLTKSTKTQIIIGVDILVATPKILLNLLKEKETRLKRIKAVVFEEIDILLKNFNEEIESVLHLLNTMSEKNTLLDAIKLIFVGKHWTPPLENLIKRLKRPPAICIGAHLEAALYGRVDINVKFIGSEEKNAYIMKLIEKNQKIVIICNTIDEIRELKDILKPYNPLFLDETCDIDEQKGVQTIWKTPSEYRVLICNDFVLNTEIFFNNSDSSIVIQYSLPESWTLFSKRFAPFLKNFGSPIFKIGSEDDKNKFKMHICLDENSNVQYEKMVKFLQRFNKNLPPEIMNLYEKMRREKEEQKIINNVEICDNIKLFGECDEIENCNFRHVLDDRDTLNNLPKSGIIKLKILHMHDITHYSVRLIQYIDSENKTHDIKDRFTEIQIKLTKLSNDEIRRPVSIVTVGTICAIEESTKVFRRVIVTKILATTSSNIPTKVEVKLLDMGAYEHVKTNDLIALPQRDLYTIPPQAVDVYIADMGPPDCDTNWSEVARIRLKSLLKQADYEEPNCYFTGRIKLQLRNTLWVNNLILREYVPDGSLKVHKFSAQPILLRNNLAEMRPGTMEKLYKLCENAGIILPDYSLPVIKVVHEVLPQVVPNWAHLENGQEYNSVYFCSADSPTRFFLRLSKNTSNFDKLIDEIQKVIRQPLYPTEFEVIENRCYLAKDPDGDQYARVLVQKLENDKAYCFFVDHGDYIVVEKSELKFLTDELIIKLPFQVIECSLYGLKSQEDEKILDKLYELAYEPDTTDLRTLYVKIIKNETPEVTNGRKYSVILIDSLNECQIINDYFVENGLAEKSIESNFADHLNVETFKLECLVEPSEINSDDEFCDLNIEDISSKVGTSEVLGATALSDADGISDESREKIDVGECIKNDYIDNYGGNFGLDLNLDEFDIVMPDLSTFISDGFKDYKTQPYISRELKSEYLAIQGPSRLEPPEHSTPNAVWSQTETHIIIKVKLTGVTDYEVHITRNKIFTFSTFANDQIYKLIITLYGKVESTTEHEAKGFHVYIKLKKLVASNWEKLNSGKQKLRNITYDPDALENQKQKPEEKVHIPFLFDEELKPKYVYEYGSDEYGDSDVNSYDSDS